MADFLQATATLEADNSELENEILQNNDDIILLATAACFMRRSLNRIRGYFEEIIPAYLFGEFKTHFRMSRETFEMFSQEIMQTGRIPLGNASGRTPIPPQKQMLIFLWAVGNREPTRTIADRFDVTFSSAHRALCRVTKGVLDISNQYIKWPNAE